MDDGEIAWLKRTADDFRWTRSKAGAVGLPFEWVVADVLRGVVDTLDDMVANAQRKKEREQEAR